MSASSLRSTFAVIAQVPGNKVVTFGPSSGTVSTAQSANSALIGISTAEGSRNGEVEVIIQGIGVASAGAPISQGQYLTSDDRGGVITANGIDRIIGLALCSALPGGEVEVLIDRG